MEKIYSSFDNTTLNLYKSLLESEGIACTICNEFPPAAGEVPAAQAYPELWILNANDKERALSIIKQYKQSQQHNHKCWRCPHCKEVIEADFNQCWQCGYLNNPQ